MPDDLAMRTYVLRLALDSPLALNQDRGRTNESMTPAVIGPATVRGALAACFQAHQASDETLAYLFDEGGIRTSSLHPLGEHEDTCTTYPVPLTVRSCKRFPGPRSETAQQHGLQDTVWALWAFAHKHALPGGQALTDLQTCLQCGNVLRRYHGPLVYRPAEETGLQWHTPETPGRLVQIHVGIDRRRHAAAHGILYARQTISNRINATLPTRYQAYVRATDAHIELLHQQLRPDAPLYLGTARSRGLGHARVLSFEPETPARSLAARFLSFSEMAQTLGLVPDGHTAFSLLLTTPAFFVDPFLRPYLEPEGDTLLQAAPADAEAVRQVLRRCTKVLQVARTATFTGWNGLARFPHRTEQGLQAGSVLVFTSPDPSDVVLDALTYLEHYGIGLRRHLGFGQVHACAPHHTDLHEMANRAIPA